MGRRQDNSVLSRICKRCAKIQPRPTGDEPERVAAHRLCPFYNPLFACAPDTASHAAPNGLDCTKTRSRMQLDATMNLIKSKQHVAGRPRRGIHAVLVGQTHARFGARRIQTHRRAFSGICLRQTDFRENTLQDVITRLEPELFKAVTGLTTCW